jgi:Tfp pilus assembly protein PilO
MKKDINSLKIRLKELDERIKAVEKQLPAHSVKPPIMTQLFELEDERDAVFKELEGLKQASAE